MSREGEEFGELGLGIDIEADPLGVVLALRDTVVHSFVMVIACMLLNTTYFLLRSGRGVHSGNGGVVRQQHRVCETAARHASSSAPLTDHGKCFFPLPSGSRRNIRISARKKSDRNSDRNQYCVPYSSSAKDRSSRP